METKQKIMTLDQLSVGESCEICQVGNQRGAVKRRLVDMGLTPGTVVTLVKIAPFGDPMELRLRGYELSLRKEDAAQIRVRPAKETTAGSDVCEKGYHITSPCSGDCAHCAHRAEEQEAMRRAHEHEQAQHPSTYDPRAHDQHQWKVALVGNPNCGKTTLFNALTGSDQYVGNWPGVTVEKKEGTAKVGDVSFTVVDLPGIYSLSPYSMEELVARRFIIGEKPDAIINIVDATNLERNLYLTMQLLELERPMVLALNFMDEVEKKGDQIDCGKLAAHLGVPVIPISARDGQNIDKLVEEAHRQMHTGLTLEPDDLYDDFTHAIHHRIGDIIHDRAYERGIPAHWAAIKLLEGDSEVAKDLGLGETTLRRIDQIARNIAEFAGFSHAMTYAFESPKAFEKLLIPEASELRKAIVISNPLGEDFSIMRTQPLNAMLTALSLNYNRRNSNVRLYDMANIYVPKTLPLTELPEEREQLTLGGYGEDIDFFTMKGVVEELFEHIGMTGRVHYDPAGDRPYFHPGRKADILYNGQVVGYLGEVHPKVCANYDFKEGVRVYIAVLDMPALIPNTSFDRHYQGIAKYPATARDISMLVPKEVLVGQIEDVLQTRGGKLLESFRLFDLYEGEQVKAGCKSVAYSLSFRAKDRTLTDEEVNGAMRKILNGLEALGIELRS